MPIPLDAAPSASVAQAALQDAVLRPAGPGELLWSR
jgi:hypothetical protein